MAQYHQTRSVWSAAAMLALAALVSSSPARAGFGTPTFGHLQVGAIYSGGGPALPGGQQVGEIDVEKSDREGPWDTIRTNKIGIYGFFIAGVTKGKINNVFISHCISPHRPICHFSYSNDFVRYDHDGRKNFEQLFQYAIEKDRLPDTLANAIVSACNDNGGATTTVGIPVGMKVEAHRFSKERGIGRTKTVYGTVGVRVNCIAPPSEVKAPPEPINVSVQVKQSSSETCPKDTTITAIADYDEPTVARLRLRLDALTSAVKHVKTRKVSFAGKTWHRAETAFKYKLDPGQHKARALAGTNGKSNQKSFKVTCPPFKIFSTWLSYEVAKTPYCPKKVIEKATFKATRPGGFAYQIVHQGGLIAKEAITFAARKGDAYVAEVTRTLTMNEFDADMMARVKDDPAANSGWTRLDVDCLEVLNATLTLRDENGPRCPRKEAALVAFETTAEGPIPYRLDCTGGRSWTGTAIAKQTAPNVYIGVAKHMLSIPKSEHVNCALKTTIQGKVKIAALRGHKYQCVNRNISPAADDITTGSVPTSSSGGTSGTLTQPPACRTHWKVSCDRRPTRVCRKVSDVVCKRVPKMECSVTRKRKCVNVPKVTCKNKVVRDCRRVPVVKCTQVRGRRVCQRTFKTNCRRKVNRVCQRRIVRKCSLVSDRTCRRTFERKCERKVSTNCEIEWKRSCRRERQRICN